LVVFVCTAAALGMWLGSRHAFKNDPMLMGVWRMLAHGGVPLAAVGIWEARAWARPRALDAALVTAGVTGLLGLCALRFTPLGADWFTAAPTLHLAVPSLVAAALVLAGLAHAGTDLRRWGIGLGDWRWWLPHHGVLLAGLIPVLVLTTVLVPPLAAFYPTYKPARTELDALFMLHGSLALDFVGWEFLFRGFLLFAVARRGDAVLAIVLQALPFFLLHGTKPEIEMLSSFVGGMFAGWFCLRARSFFPLYVIHWVMITTVGCTSFVLRALG
jgi:membrane protease YdiL (CAAX protease family)